MRVVVDLNACEANGVCTGLAPEVFELIDDDRLVVSQQRPHESLRARVEQVVQQCHRQAITLEDQ